MKATARPLFKNGKILLIDPPLDGANGKKVPRVSVIADTGKMIIVRSATLGVQLSRMVGLVPGTDGVTITPEEESLTRALSRASRSAVKEV